MKPEECTAFQDAVESAPVRRLLAKAQRGDEEAFKTLYDAYKRRVFSLCLAISRTQSSAEDLTCHVFAKVFRSIGEVEEEDLFIKLIDQWAIRLSISYRKREEALNQNGQIR
ncbi:MAG: RNA polymerase sigma factor [Terriglobia bacterium]